MNEHLRFFYQEQLRKIDTSLLNLYEVIRYTTGHRQLIVMAESGIEPSKESTKLFIIFEGVQYLQLLTRWKDAIFELASPTVHQSLLELTGIEDAAGFELVFYVPSAQKNMFVVCSNMYIAEGMPKLYEYFDDEEVVG